MKYLRYIGLVAAVPAVFFSCWIAVFYYELGTPVEEHIFKRYQRFVDKQSVLDRFADKQKIVIVSGSNSLYGLNARRIEDTIGITTINMAVNVHTGLRYYFTRVKQDLRKGDIVVLPLEYLLYSDVIADEEFPKDTMLMILRQDPGFFQTLSSVEKLRLIFNIHYTSLISGLLYPLPSENRLFIYQSNDDRWRGDIDQKILHEPGKAEDHELPALRYADDSVHLGYLRKFVAWARKEGIEVIGAYPVFVRVDTVTDAGNRAFFQSVSDFWKKLGVPVIGRPQDSMYPNRLLNSLYHLTTEGRKIHTSQIIRYLQEYLADRDNRRHH